MLTHAFTVTPEFNMLWQKPMAIAIFTMFVGRERNTMSIYKLSVSVTERTLIVVFTEKELRKRNAVDLKKIRTLCTTRTKGYVNWTTILCHAM